MERFRKIVKLFLGLPLTLLSFIFIGKIIFDSWGEISRQIKNMDLTLLVLGVLFMIAFFLIRAVAWVKVLSFFGESEMAKTAQIYNYSLAETKRYIPGSIFSFVSRVHKFKGGQHTTKAVVKALAVEAIFMVSASFVVSIPGLINLSSKQNFLGVAGITGGVSVFVPFIIFLFLKPSVKRKVLTTLLKIKDIDFVKAFDTLLISIFLWILFGISNYLIATSLFPNNPNNILLFSSLFTLSWLIGYLAFIVPMGLGVREATVIYLFTGFLPIYTATIIALISRVVLIASEIIFVGIAYLLNRNVSFLRSLSISIPEVILGATALVYMIYFSFFSIVKHSNFYTGKFDLGNMEQTVWNTVNGNFFIFSNPDGVGELSRLSAHSDFFLVLITPFYFLFPHATTLLLVQTLIIGAGGFFVYLIARKVIVSYRLSILLSIGYYLNFWIHEQNLFDFHSVSVATTFLLGAFYFLIEKRYKLFSFMILLALITKENVFLVSSIIGGFIFIQSKLKWGIYMAIASFLTFLFLMTFAIPGARGGSHFALDYLSYLGDSPIQILLSPIMRPFAFFGRLFSVDTIHYIYLNLLPTGFLSVFAPLYLIFMLPDLLINIFSNNPNLRSIQYHYGALLVPFVYIASIYGIKNLLSMKGRVISKDLIFYYLLAFVIMSTWRYSPIIGMKHGDSVALIAPANKEVIVREVSNIPRDASVSATNSIAAHLVQREKIYVYPNGIDFVDFVVLYKDEVDEMHNVMISNPKFAVMVREDNFVILKRINSPYKVDMP